MLMVTDMARTNLKHAHHWVIDPPNGPLSPGRCKLSGQVRAFANSNEAIEWERPTEEPEHARSAGNVDAYGDNRALRRRAA